MGLSHCISVLTGKHSSLIWGNEDVRCFAGAFSPLRTSQPVVQQSAKLAKQDTLQRKKSRKMDANAVTPLLTSRTMAPAGRGIERPEASANKADYRPLSRSFA